MAAAVEAVVGSLEKEEALSRTGSNGGGKGGRNYRLNWMISGDKITFGEWVVESAKWGDEIRFVVWHKGVMLRRRHGNYEGTLFLKTQEHAKRWVEKRVRARAMTR